MSKKKAGGVPEHHSVQSIIEESRRRFLRNLGISGAAVVSGSMAVMAGLKHEKDKHKEGYVRVLTPENKLVKVPLTEMQDYKPALKDLQEAGREGIPGKKWVMVIDLAKCRNARKCIEACQSAHHLRPYEYHINTLVMQDNVHTPAYFMPKPCQHCDNPPCVSVCPVDATFKRQDGVVLIDNERCIGCRFCMAACPYSARMFHWQEPIHTQNEKLHPYNVELNVPQKKGTISKCLFSSDRLREQKLPYCVSACPNGVYYFGDENEDALTNGTTKETVRLSELLEKNGAFRLMAELGTKPRVYYLPPKDRIFPFNEYKPSEEDYTL
jgi:molybdopterin-containing oxidoreductase family iron-sulfur binding subunit